jgi:hypothetical protein
MVNTGSILGNSYNNKDFGNEITENSTITVDPSATDLYEEATTEDPDELKRKDRLRNLMYDLFVESEWHEKYGAFAITDEDGNVTTNDKKVEKKDIKPLYEYFEHFIVDVHGYDEMEAICTICEFFQLNYKTIYDNILPPLKRASLLRIIKERYGISKELRRTHKLF